MVIFFTDIKVATAYTDGHAGLYISVEIAAAAFKKVKVTGNFLRKLNGLIRIRGMHGLNSNEAVRNKLGEHLAKLIGVNILQGMGENGHSMDTAEELNCITELKSATGLVEAAAFLKKVGKSIVNGGKISLLNKLGRNVRTVSIALQISFLNLVIIDIIAQCTELVNQVSVAQFLLMKEALTEVFHVIIMLRIDEKADQVEFTSRVLGGKLGAANSGYPLSLCLG